MAAILHSCNGTTWHQTLETAFFLNSISLHYSKQSIFHITGANTYTDKDGERVGWHDLMINPMGVGGYQCHVSLEFYAKMITDLNDQNVNFKHLKNLSGRYEVFREGPARIESIRPCKNFEISGVSL